MFEIDPKEENSKKFTIKRRKGNHVAKSLSDPRYRPKTVASKKDYNRSKENRKIMKDIEESS